MYRSPTDPEAEAASRWLWNARGQLTRFSTENYARHGRGITVITAAAVLDPEAEIPAHQLAYHTPETIRRLKPTGPLTPRDLEGWISATQHYDPSTHWVGALVMGSRNPSTLFAPLTTVASDARHRFVSALTVRPLGLDVVRDAARRYFAELMDARYAAHEIDMLGRRAAALYQDAFTRYDHDPVFGLQVARAIAEGFHLADTDPAPPENA